jgi:hypothetical protein
MSGVQSTAKYVSKDPEECLKNFVALNKIFNKAGMTVEFYYQPGFAPGIAISTPFQSSDPVNTDLRRTTQLCDERLEAVRKEVEKSYPGVLNFER